jgi:hypothetical protein
MTKFDNEHTSQIKGAIKFLENTTCDNPGATRESQEMRHKNIKEYVEKLIKKFEESKD